MNSSSTFLRMITSADFWELHPEWLKLPSNNHQIKTGHVKHTDLNSVFEEFPEEPVANDIEMEEDKQEPASIIRRVDRKIQKKADVDKQILDLYFLECMRPSVICKALRVDKRYVYKVVEHSKKALITLSEKRHDTTKSWKIPNFILIEIQEFWNVHRSKLYKVEEVRSYLKSKYPLSHIPSLSFIARYMKMSLNLSYKKVSWRPLKVLGPEIVNLKLSYISFVEKAERLGFKILQIDEFSISESLFSFRAWTTKGRSGYAVYEGQPSKRYSVIAAISKGSLELSTISELNTNGSVFIEFIDELENKLAEKYWEWRKAFILTWDGAKYHSTTAVRNKINELGLTWVQTVPYTPEFSPIEIFNNWVKSAIRQSIRKQR